jgi:mono/diheme cytochrome c family protein
MSLSRAAAMLVLACAISVSGCTSSRSNYGGMRVVGGDPDRGAALIRETGCGACHSIPGIREADSFVGPPLTAWSRRTFIAGSLPNVPENLMDWVANAHTLYRDGAMPNFDFSRQQERDVAAYLYTLD